MFRHWRPTLGCAASFATLALALFTASPAVAQGAPDQIDLRQATVYNSPADIASWPVTASITKLTMARPAGLSFEFTKKATWPNYTPPGWSGPLEYTVWAVVKVNGHWYTSGFIQMWRDRASTGAPILTDFAINWAYDSRWGPMNHYQPHVGEQMGFFVSAGNARNWGSVTSVRERSNVVAVNLPANDTGVFTFSAAPATSMVLAGDFDLNTKPDLISQSQTGLVSLAMNNGTAFVQLESPYNNVVSTWKIVGVDDFNNDGKADLLWQGPTGAVAAWLNNGSSQPGGAYLYNGTTVWHVAAVVDMDGNGSPDLIWQSPTGQVAIWYMQGTTELRADVVWAGATPFRVVGAGDFNNDGDPDIVWQGPIGDVVVWTMHSTVHASGITLSRSASTWKLISVGDINGDRQADLLWQSPSGQLYVWFMNGQTAIGGSYVKATATGWTFSTTP